MEIILKRVSGSTATTNQTKRQEFTERKRHRQHTSTRLVSGKLSELGTNEKADSVVQGLVDTGVNRAEEDIHCSCPAYET